MLHGSLFGSMIRAGISQQAYRVSGSAAGRQFHAFSQIPRNAGAYSGLITGPNQSSILGDLGMKLGLLRVAENAPLPCALSFRSFIHSGEKSEVEARESPKSMDNEQALTQDSGNGVNGQPPIGQLLPGQRRTRVNTRPPVVYEPRMSPMLMDLHPPSTDRRKTRANTRPPVEYEAVKTPMSMDFVQGLIQGNGGPFNQTEVQTGRLPRRTDSMQGRFQGRDNGRMGGGPGFFDQPQLESNADIVHIKLMRNNSYVTLTNHKGDRKMSVSAGQVAAKGDKPGRYSGEAAAEYMGRAAKQMKISSVVVKVSGFSHFKRKKDAILAFKDGYTHSRGDVNPVVYIEDTTRKPHNGCRLPKKRRI